MWGISKFVTYWPKNQERDTGCCWYEAVAGRDAPTLERIITGHVLPGTTIVTDAWGGYNVRAQQWPLSTWGDCSRTRICPQCAYGNSWRTMDVSQAKNPLSSSRWYQSRTSGLFASYVGLIYQRSSGDTITNNMFLANTWPGTVV